MAGLRRIATAYARHPFQSLHGGSMDGRVKPGHDM